MLTPAVPQPTMLPYLQVADAVFRRRLTHEDLPTAVTPLPALDKPLLTALAQQADTAVLSQPAYAYALMSVADAAAQRSSDLLVRALAAWQLARAANGWVQPRLVETAVARARALFAQLSEPGWLAACDWQLNALPWTRPNFTQAAAELEQALAALLAAGFDDLVPWCRLSLAYALLLLSRFADAERETVVAQQTFQHPRNTLGLAQCLYTRASALRRQTRFEAAKSDYTAALDLFQEAGAAVHIAITTFQLGQIHWWSQYDGAAAATLQQAAAQFAAADLPLWQAQCQFGLGQIYQQTGQLAAATAAMQTARETFAQFQLRGLWADSLFDSGWLAFYYGQHQTSLDYFQQAQTLYSEIGAHWQHALILMHEGEVYLQMGLFQRALQRLEDSHSRLQALGFPQRLAACEIRLARVYLQLNNIPRAHTYLDQAVAHYHQAAPNEDYPAVHILRAELLFREGKREEALLFWQKALATAQQQGDQVQTARAQRLLGQALCATGHFDEARGYLQTAVSHFAAMGMVMDQAAGQVNLGQHYAQTGQPNAARAAWKTALDLAQGAAPELTWQVYAGMGQLAAASGEAVLALAEYRRAVAALGKMRRALWQPAIAGAYLTRPRALLDQAVALAMTQTATADALYFIEESKAQTTAYQLAAPAAMRPNLPAQLADLVSEIRWLQQQVSQNSSSGLLGLAKVKEQHQQFVQKVRQYDAAMSRLERANRATGLPTAVGEAFSLAQFRQLALAHHGEKWLALDYYQTDETISGVMITAGDLFSWSIPITPAIRLALDMGIKAGHGRSLSPRHLATLGRALLPDFVRGRLTPETHLLIAPHRQLHRLPWAALQFAEDGPPLVMAAIPALTPSLHNLALLWQRDQTGEWPGGQPGLLVAVADFQGRHAALTAVPRETAALLDLFGSGVQPLINAEATFANWQRLRQTDGLARFGFLHMATHAFADAFSGRLSGIALHDRDLWLDELASMAPLPPLITLSACSGLRTLLYEGDEPMGLPTACLAAGAQRVVGALWPIVDDSAPELMADFYRFLLAGMGAAEALAWAQRTAVRQAQPKLDIVHWGGFLCIGQP